MHKNDEPRLLGNRLILGHEKSRLVPEDVLPHALRKSIESIAEYAEKEGVGPDWRTLTVRIGPAPEETSAMWSMEVRVQGKDAEH